MPGDEATRWVEEGHALHRQKRYDEALAAFERAARLAPERDAGPFPRYARHWHTLRALRLTGSRTPAILA